MTVITEPTIPAGDHPLPLMPGPGRRSGFDAQLTDALHDVVESLSSTGSTAQALLTAADRACGIFGVDRASIFLRAPSGAAFHGVAAQTPGDSSLVHRLRCGPSTDRMSQQIIDQQAPVLVRDPVRDGRPARTTMLELNVKEVLGVPMSSHNTLTGLMFLDRVGHYREFTESDTEIATHFASMVAAVVPAARRLDELRRQVNDLRLRAQRDDGLTAAAQHLSALAARGATPQQILDLIAQLTGHGCVFTDSRHRVLATDTVEPIGTALLQALTQSLAQSGGHTGAGRIRLAKTTALTCQVTAEGTVRGHLTLIPHRRLRGEDTQILGVAAATLATELRVAAARSAGAVDQRRHLAQALFEGRTDPRVERLATHLNVPLTGTRLVGVVEKRTSSPIQLSADDLVAVFESQFGAGAVLAAPVPGGSDSQTIAIIIDIDNADGPPSDLRRRTSEALRRADPEPLLAAFGAAEHALAGIVAGLSGARRTMHVLRTLCPPEVTCLTLDDLGFGAPLLHSIDREGALLHLRRVFGSGDPGAAGREHIDTVSTYFSNGRSIRDTARELDVHENTVRYRLKKFHTASRLDLLANPEHQVTCQLALLIDRLMTGSLDPRVPPAEEIS